MQCGSCRQVSYCSKACQRADWSKRRGHKVECKVFKLFKATYGGLPGDSLENRHSKIQVFQTTLPHLIENDELSAALPEEVLPKKQRPTFADLRNFSSERFGKFVYYGRVCSVCLANDFSLYEAGQQTVDWQHCPVCKYGWCCSQDHWNEYKSKHSPEICQSYQNVVRMETFHFRSIMKHKEMLGNPPRFVLSTRLSTFPKDWKSYWKQRYAEDYVKHSPFLPPEFWPATTRLMSQPVTCLFAMYQYGISHFDSLEDLTIHVVGGPRTKHHRPRFGNKLPTAFRGSDG